MRKIKLLLIAGLTLGLAGFLLLRPPVVAGSRHRFTHPEASDRYAELEVLTKTEDSEFIHGLRHERYDAKTFVADAQDVKTHAGKWTEQKISTITVPQGAEIKAVPWAFVKDSKWRLQSLRLLAKDYEAMHPGEKVIAAVNGDYYDINGNNNFPYGTCSAHASHGDFFKAKSEYTAIGFPNDGTRDSLLFQNYPDTGSLTAPVATELALEVLDERGAVVATYPGVAENPQTALGTNETAIFYGRYLKKQGWPWPRYTAQEVTDAYLYEAGTLLPVNDIDLYARGAENTFSSKTLAAGEFALKTTHPEVLAAIQAGSEIRVQRRTVFTYRGTERIVDDVMGVSHMFLVNGKYLGDHERRAERYPRMLVGRKENGDLLFVSVDGRQEAAGMYGTGDLENAAVLDYFGVIDAADLDGGGSATMLVMDGADFRVVNSPSDGHERSVSNGIMLVAKAPDIKHSVGSVTRTSATVTAQVEDPHGYTLGALYVKVGSAFYPLIDGVAQITALDSNTAYHYEIFHKVADNYETLLACGDFYTYKAPPGVTGGTIYPHGGGLALRIALDDPDQAVQALIVYYGPGQDDFAILQPDAELVLTPEMSEASELRLEVKFVEVEGAAAVLQAFPLTISYDAGAGFPLVKNKLQRAFRALFAE